MKIELLVVSPCTACDQARDVWEAACRQHALKLEIIDVSESDGEAMLQSLGLKTVPAILFDRKVKGVGVQSPEDAERLLVSELGNHLA